MADAKTLEELAQPEYWNARYQRKDNEPTYEWFKSFASLAPFFSERLTKPAPDGKTPRIVHLGCGNSTLPIDLYQLGYKNQICLDFSEVVIESMASRFADKAGVQWKVADVRQMVEMTSESFEAAIDKGTLDAMLSGSLWDPPDEVKKNTAAYIDEVARILKPGGVFLYITYRQPHFMKPILAREGVWSLSVVTIVEEAGSFEYFGFVMEKV